jgi:uncharacterized membrane protein
VNIFSLKKNEREQMTEDLSRIIALSDGIFAVAITLLVLDIGIPSLEQYSGGELNIKLQSSLSHSLGSIACYVISFLVVGICWRAHHQIFQHIKRSNAILAYLNLVLLMVIAFLPVPTGYIGNYGSSPIAVIFYAPVVALTGLILWAIWLYATIGHRFVDRDLHPDYIRYYTISFLITPVIFLLSIPIVYVNVFEPVVSGPDLAKYFWILSLPIHSIWRNIYYGRVNLQKETVDEEGAQEGQRRSERVESSMSKAVEGSKTSEMAESRGKSEKVSS